MTKASKTWYASTRTIDLSVNLEKNKREKKKSCIYEEKNNSKKIKEHYQEVSM